MKIAVQLLIAIAWLIPGARAQAAVRQPARVQFAGREYVRLSEWASANQFQIRWTTREKNLQLTNRTARLAFTVDSAQSRINGVEVWLSFPILLRNGFAYVSQLDLTATISPLLHPTASRAGTKIKTICIDPGHGGNDPGLRAGRNLEKKYNLLLAQELQLQLKLAGFNVVMTRTRDVSVDLPTRPELARKRGADLFISVHFNTFPGPPGEARGAETYCLTPAGAFSSNFRGEGDTRGLPGNRDNEKNVLLAYLMQKSLVTNAGIEDRGVKRARYAVLRDTAMPAILIEGGFMTHPVEGKKILDPAYRRQMAKAMVSGIMAYKRIVDPPPTISAPHPAAPQTNHASRPPSAVLRRTGITPH